MIHKHKTKLKSFLKKKKKIINLVKEIKNPVSGEAFEEW